MIVFEQVQPSKNKYREGCLFVCRAFQFAFVAFVCLFFISLCEKKSNLARTNAEIVQFLAVAAGQFCQKEYLSTLYLIFDSQEFNIFSSIFPSLMMMLNFLLQQRTSTTKDKGLNRKLTWQERIQRRCSQGGQDPQQRSSSLTLRSKTGKRIFSRDCQEGWLSRPLKNRRKVHL